MGSWPTGSEVLPPTSETVAYPAAKRYACDRCRTQKLRCPRDTHRIHEPCTRCTRAGAVCVTSNAKPLGRPSRGDHRPVPSSPRGSGTPNTARHSSPQVPSTHHESYPPSVEMPSTQQIQQTTEAWDQALYPWSQPTRFPSLPQLDDTTMLDGDAGPTESQMALPFPPMAAYTPALTPPVAWADPAEFLNVMGAGSGSARELHNKDEMAIIPPRDRTEAVQRLASLGGSWHGLLDHLDNSLWDTLLVSIACSNASNPANAPKGNPFSEVLKGTAEFVAILQALHPSPSTPSPHPDQRGGISPAGSREISSMSTPSTSSVSDGSPSHRPSTSSSGRDQPRVAALSTPIILMIIACHLQIVQIYEFIFSQGRVSLQAMPEEDIAGFRMLGGLQLAGIPLSQGHLQVKILIQVIEHQLHQMERLMGLPVEYRLSGRTEAYNGLLSSFESMTLLRAAMSRTEGDQGNAGINRILSLKETMKKVQQML
ncbi:hypothetical protein BO71DRAFT_393679 [Aspergillus ellipticus CBS 707.79]|uniref:Zn(2)-C6 fungal-type domain-containing protein n=1 Tax=Aspergillus ellipticus CBS 707.79 TaxID=1448320 RepID=A0A319DQR3_9EURO|nr:hypothetical protein BO71DRAFT_393679 [Aspergillus ellipticus CBS 707.79]